MMNEEKTKTITINKQHDLKGRTKAFAIGIVRLYSALPKTKEAQIVGNNCFGAGRPWERIIVKPFVPGPARSS